jgi:hypothetical protein
MSSVVAILIVALSAPSSAVTIDCMSDPIIGLPFAKLTANNWAESRGIVCVERVDIPGRPVDGWIYDDELATGEANCMSSTELISLRSEEELPNVKRELLDDAKSAAEAVVEASRGASEELEEPNGAMEELEEPNGAIEELEDPWDDI